MRLPILKLTTLSLFLAAAAAFAQGPRVLPSNTEIKVRTGTEIPAKPAANATYSARVADDVVDESGKGRHPSRLVKPGWKRIQQMTGKILISTSAL